MAGAMRKMAVYLGLVEDDGYDGRGFDPDDEFEPELDPELEPIPAFRTMVPPETEGNGTSDKNGDGEQGDKSLRFRLAQSAARKKGLGDLEPPSS